MYGINRPKCVVGLGYGDEGKGMTTAFLAQQAQAGYGRSVVVRYNGGPQAAHNVRVTTPDGKVLHHTFSQLGAGTLTGAATILSEHTLLQPYALVKETTALIAQTGNNPLPLLSVDPKTPLLLPVHAQCNRMLETTRAKNGRRHGSTGMGVGVARDYELAMKESGSKDAIPTASDLARPFLLADKMRAQAEWLGKRWGMDFHYTKEQAEDQATELHLMYADFTAGGAEFIPAWEALEDYRWTPGAVVFEGSQGILLDLRYGFFPHVTYGWMDAGNARALSKRASLTDPLVVGCTRTYSTRHGNGLFPPEDTFDVEETDNGTGVWQGAFRTGLLDLPMLEYGAGLVKPDVLSVSCEDLYPGKTITRWENADGEPVRPGDYALAADDGIRRRDDDASFDPENVYAPLHEAKPVIEEMGLDAVLEAIRETANAPIAMDGAGAVLSDWTDRPLAEVAD